MLRAPLAALGLVLALVPPGCATAPPPGFVGPEAPEKVYPSALQRRLARLRVGQSAEEARALIGTPLVRRPGAPGGSYPSPLRRIGLLTPGGRRVDIELYVVAAAPAEGCPDVHTALAPVVYLDGEIAALDWDYVERHWREWGGELAALRDARGVHECPFPPSGP